MARQHCLSTGSASPGRCRNQRFGSPSTERCGRPAYSPRPRWWRTRRRNRLHLCSPPSKNMRSRGERPLEPLLEPYQVRTAVACVSMSIVVLLSAVLGCKKTYGPDVVATVNGQPIQRSEVEKFYRENLGNNKEQPTKEQAEATRLGILKSLIDDEIVQQAAKKMNLVAGDEEVDAKQAEMKAPYTQEEWDKKLQASDLSLDELRVQIRRNLTAEKLLNKEVNSRINITDADVASFYNSNKTQFNFIEPKYDIADIVVTSQPTKMQQGANLQNSKAGSDVEARRKIDMIHNRLESGEDFATLAQNLSENTNDANNGGNMGFIPESSLRSQPLVFAAISRLQPGQMTDVIPLLAPGSKT